MRLLQCVHVVYNAVHGPPRELCSLAAVVQCPPLGVAFVILLLHVSTSFTMLCMVPRELCSLATAVVQRLLNTDCSRGRGERVR